ncbi:MAG: hypothetical protein M0R74_00105 [Dehalococcoidia bacterium]|nr:hypothetical protein [Dehalococcoidia bacterium]
MRFIWTVVSAAILLLLAYLFLAWMVDGYFGGNIAPSWLEPDSWDAPDSWSEWRDIVIVIGGIFAALAFLLLCVLIAALVFLVFTARRMLKENVAPAVDSLKDSLDNVRGTTEFAGETVVSPIIRVYSVVRGVRAGVGAVTNLPGRVRGRRGGRKR